MRGYYIYDGQMKKGPFDLAQLKLQPLQKETPIWYEGLKDWVMAGNIDDLKGLFNEESVPPPLTKMLQKNEAIREKILSSFSEATERYPENSYEKKKKNLYIIISVVVIACIIGALFLFKVISFPL
jgi:hypothetical protein